jgi:hypothetical protein
MPGETEVVSKVLAEAIVTCRIDVIVVLADR